MSEVGFRPLEKMLRETARQLLAEGKVEVIIGFEGGTLPLRTTPCFIRDPEQVERLVWDLRCENNLAKYLQHVTGKVGIVAKGCDGRSIVGEIVERQIPRENVVIIGVPCQGVIDRRAIQERWRMQHPLDGREVLEMRMVGGQVVLRGTDADGACEEETLDVQQVLCDDCVICRHKNPPVYDVLVGEPSEGVQSAAQDIVGGYGGAPRHATVQELESWTADERWEYFSQEFGRCIRCYACRQACPCCYCSVCFVDQTQPSWFGKSDDLSDVMAFHLVRIYHVAGRCLDCGACARACPMHIDLRTLGRELEKDVGEMYDYETGMDLESPPLWGTFRPDDPQEFIK